MVQLIVTYLKSANDFGFAGVAAAILVQITMPIIQETVRQEYVHTNRWQY
jgi:hypothetical protein